MQGWVSVHRSLQSHWLWVDKPFSRGQAWIDILLLANHQDNKFLLGNELVEVEQGSFITSEVKLMERWGWSKSKVRSFLKLLESDEMLIKKSDTKKTTLTVVNYKHYQDKKTTEEPQKNHEKTAKEPRKDTNNNDNNENNENNDNKEYIYSPVVDYLNLKANKTYKSTTKKTQTLIKARQNEGFTLEDFKKVIDNKVFSWQGTEWEKYLRPETLFGTKFESYLNEGGGKNGDTRANDDEDPWGIEKFITRG